MKLDIHTYILDTNARKRNRRFIFSKCNSRCTIYMAIRFMYKQMRHRDMLFRYTNRHDFIAPTTDCSPRVIFVFLSYPLPFRSLGFLFFVICTPNRAELLQYYGNSGGGSSGSSGSSGSRKSQINPFVIPHRSFQPVRISTTRFYATSAPSRNSSLFSSVPLPSCQERTALSSPSLHLLFSSRLALPYFRHFSFSPFLLVPLLHLCQLSHFIFLSFFVSFLSHISFLSSNFTCLLSRFDGTSTPSVRHLFRSLFPRGPQ